jgi:hypothetical protein
MKRTVAVMVGGVLVVACGGSKAWAQEEQPEQTPPEQGKEQGQDEGEAPRVGLQATRITLSLGAEASFNADFNDAPGSVSVFRQSAGLQAAIPLQERLRLELSFNTEHSGFDFSDSAGIVPGSAEPFEDLWRHTVGGQAIYVQDATWTYLVGGSVTSAGEDNATFSDTITGRVYGGFLYRVSPSFQIGLGAGVVTRLEDDPVIFPLPLIQFSYAFDEKTTLNIGTLEGVNLTYQANEEVAVILGASYRYEEYRLRDDGPVPDGVFSQWRVPVSATARWTPTPNIVLSLTAGIEVFANYTIEDTQGNEIVDTGLDPALFIGGVFRYKF